jgi:hypothetical protein
MWIRANNGTLVNASHVASFFPRREDWPMGDERAYSKWAVWAAIGRKKIKMTSDFDKRNDAQQQIDKIGHAIRDNKNYLEMP